MSQGAREVGAPNRGEAVLSLAPPIFLHDPRWKLLWFPLEPPMVGWSVGWMDGWIVDVVIARSAVVVQNYVVVVVVVHVHCQLLFRTINYLFSMMELQVIALKLAITYKC